MKIIIADDHPVVLMGVKAVLAAYGNRFTIAGDARDGNELIAVLAKTSCDLVITDFAMSETGNMDGLPLLHRIRTRHPDLPILVLTRLDNTALMKSIMAVGVRGIVDKMAMATEILDAIDTIQEGKLYLSQRIREQAHSMFVPTESALSVREMEVVRLFAQGMTVSQIAQMTHRSITTISNQKRKAMRRLGIDQDKQLHEYAREQGLV